MRFVSKERAKKFTMSFGPTPKNLPGGGTPKHFGPSARTIRKRVIKAGWGSDEFENLDDATLESKYPNILNFYMEPPGCDIRLETMETLAMERLRFLRIIDKYSSQKKDEEWMKQVKEDVNSNGLSDYLNLSPHGLRNREETCYRNRAKDYFSHFILRLAYCRTDDLRRWFISQEVDAFKLRCMMFPEVLESLTQTYNLGYQKAEKELTERFKDELINTYNSTYRKSKSDNLNVDNVKDKEFYKVKFTEALDLVRGRKVFLYQGQCFVPISDIQHLLTFQFKSLLTQNVALTSKILPNLDEDDRLIRMLSELDKRYTGADYSADNNTDVVRPEQIKSLKDKGAFPLCMRSMQTNLEKNHHLKYKSRLQYGLFLKGIGLSLDDAIRFFRGEFTQSHIDADKFDKEYTYGIRYNYGKEGKKVNWAPWNCMRIIMESVGPGECHGCPYRHHDPDVLRGHLVQSGLEGEALNQVMHMAKDGHYQKACSLQFKSTHKGQELSTGITEHPNQFYQESVHGGPKGGTAGQNQRANLKTERANLYN